MLKDVLQEMINWVYPQTCLLCASHLPTTQAFICSKCLLSLPETDNGQFVSNHIQHKFTGRAPVAQLYVPYYYESQSTEELIKKVKYTFEPKLGVLIGNLLAHKLKNQAWIKDISYIVPVPLHPSKKAKRGYNQAALICEGIRQVHKHIQILPDLILRDLNTKSQTTKNRSERLKNVENAFSLNPKFANEVKEKANILLIDDVLTTGATIESCVLALTKLEQVHIYAATFAMPTD